MTGSGTGSASVTLFFINMNYFAMCGEIAYHRMTELDGNSSYRNYMIDAMYRLKPAELEKGARYEVQ